MTTTKWLNLYDPATATEKNQQKNVGRKWRGAVGAVASITATWSVDQTAETFVFPVTVAERFIATETVRLQFTRKNGN